MNAKTIIPLCRLQALPFHRKIYELFLDILARRKIFFPVTCDDFFTLLFLKLKLMIFFNWLRARLAFILASFEFGAERFIFAPPSFTKKRDYVSAREKVRMTSFRAKKRHVNRRGTRGK